MFKVVYLSPDAAGFAAQVEVHQGTTLWTLLQQQGITTPGEYSVRVNGAPALADEPLQPGDRIVVGYKNLKAA